MTRRTPEYLVLAICPITRGFGFALLEGPLSPVDWGVHEVERTNKNARCLGKIGEYIERYQPDVVVLEDWTTGSPRRSARIRRLAHAIEQLARTNNVDVYCYSRPDIRRAMSALGAVTRYEIAQAIAAHIPAFAASLPRPRKIWESEDPRMGMFNAAALALTYFQGTERQEPTTT